MQILGTTNINFIKWRWHAIVFSTVLIIAGVGQIVAQGGLKLGVDFSGGTALVLRFEQPIAEDAVRGALAGLTGDPTVQRYGEPGDNQILIRLPQQELAEGQSIDDASNDVETMIRAANIGAFQRDKAEIVGPVIARDLQQKGIYATLTALAGILVYIGLRFRFTFAVGAIVATFHDVIITLIFLNWFGYEMSLNTIAALLTITGYSVNDTIVIFDRVRENSRMMRRDSLEPVVNLSVNQTLARTIITAGTTFLAVSGLYLYGGEALEGFAFTMLVGVVAGTYSTVFIAAAIAILLTKPPVPTGSAARVRTKKS